MLPRAHRLNSREDFQKVYKQGKFFSVGIILLNCMPNGLNKTRIGYIVSKKVSPKATARNNIRRKMREITRKYLKNIKTGFDVVITMHAKATEFDAKQLQPTLEQLLRKSKLLQ